MHRRWPLLAAAAMLVAALGCGSDDATGPSSPVSTLSVSMSNLRFNPAAISVAKGATVTWTNNDNTLHNVTFANSAITNIASFSSGSRTAAMPAQAGTYSYSCTLHSGMNGSVVVQ